MKNLSSRALIVIFAIFASGFLGLTANETEAAFQDTGWINANSFGGSVGPECGSLAGLVWGQRGDSISVSLNLPEGNYFIDIFAHYGYYQNDPQAPQNNETIRVRTAADSVNVPDLNGSGGERPDRDDCNQINAGYATYTNIAARPIRYNGGFLILEGQGSNSQSISIRRVRVYGDSVSPPTPIPTPTPTPTPSPLPVSVSLIANPPVIREGSSSILSWVSSNATSCLALGDAWFGARVVSGNETVSPNQTTIYRISCTNSAGSSATAQTIVTVTRDTLVVSGPTVTLIANPSTIRRSETSILTWNTTNATSCIAQGDGWFGARNISGNETVTLSQTTTFRINCSNSAGSASAQTTVNVIDDGGGLPGVDITANPTSINQGASSVLIWSSVNATSCFALNNWSGSKSISGSETVSPSFTATYTITCSNSRGSASDSVTVFVISTPIITPQSFTVACVASPFVVSLGQETTLAAGQTGGVEPVSFTWGGIVSGQGKVIRRAMNLPGIHTVTITATDATGRVARGSCQADPLIAKAAGNNSNNSQKTSAVIKAPEKLSPAGKEYSSSTTSVQLKWKSVKGAKSYAVRVDFPNSTLRDERNNCPTNSHYVCINRLSENDLSIDVEPGKTYSWWVHAIDASGNVGEPASAWFSVREKTAGRDNFFANIFGSAGKATFILGLIILGFILGYALGKKNKPEIPTLNL